jgi:hypothetical protein
MSDSGVPIAHATVTLEEQQTGKLLSFAFSDDGGKFQITLTARPRYPLLIRAEHMGHAPDSLIIRVDPPKVPIIFRLRIAPTVLPVVTVSSTDRGLRVRGDTLEFTAARYMGPETRKVGDLISNMEGFTVAPDGRISFNGQELERIMVNGEDMTGRNYRVLSQSLRAGLVEKVQLIRNDNEDRLMRAVIHSGKVGINLTIPDSLVKKLSGGFEAGATAAGRKDMEGHAIRLSGPTRWMALFHENETGKPASGNRDFYAGGDMGLPAETGSGPYPVHTGTISPPPLPDAYVRDGRDASGTIMLGGHARGGTQWKWISGLDHQAYQRNMDARSSYLVPGAAGWELSTREQEESMGWALFSMLTFSHDGGRNNRGSGSLLCSTNGTSAQFSGRTDGAVRDMLFERMKEGSGRCRINVTESIKLGKGVIRCSMAAEVREGRQQFEVETSRLHVLTGTDTGSDRILEELPMRSREHVVDMGYARPIAGRSLMAGLRWKGGISQRSAVSYALTPADAARIILPYTSASFGQGMLSAYGNMIFASGRNASFSVMGEAGPGAWRASTAHEQRLAAFFYDVRAGYERRLSPFRTISAVYKASRYLPDGRYVHPDVLLGGNATIFQPALDISPASQRSVMVSAVSRSLSSGSGMMLLVNYSVTRNDIILAPFLQPGVTLLTPVSSPRSEIFHLNVSGDRYLSGLRMKLSGSMGMTMQWGRVPVNSAWNARRMSNTAWELRSASGWKGKLNMEASWRWEHTRISTLFEDGTSRQYTSDLFRSQVKWKFRMNERLYAATALQYLHMDGLSGFPAWDAFFSWNIGGGLQCSVEAHDILGMKSISLRNISPESYSTNRYQLVPRYVMAKVDWSF